MNDSSQLLPDVSLDSLDYGIIRELQEDGRRAFREVARNLDVPESTIRTRVKRLQEQGVLQILAFTDPAHLGRAAIAMLFLRVDPLAHEEIVTTLERWPEVCYLSTTLGRSDICAQVLCGDDRALWQLTQRVRSLPGILQLDLMQEIKVHKIRFTLPEPDPKPDPKLG